MRLHKALCCVAVLLAMGSTEPTALSAGQHQTDECVVLLHGLGRTWRSMDTLADALQREGYRTVNIDYPSRSQSIEVLADTIVPLGLARCRSETQGPIHFVTHSMGGILLRYYLAEHRAPRLGRIVMLSPPNQGSEIVDELRNYELYRWIIGPAGMELGTDENSLPRQIGPATFPVGIITGNENSVFDAWFAELIPGTDDGKVSVASARLDGMTDFLVVPAGHTDIMDDEGVIEQTLHFLRTGQFRAPSAD